MHERTAAELSSLLQLPATMNLVNPRQLAAILHHLSSCYSSTGNSCQGQCLETRMLFYFFYVLPYGLSFPPLSSFSFHTHHHPHILSLCKPDQHAPLSHRQLSTRQLQVENLPFLSSGIAANWVFDRHRNVLDASTWDLFARLSAQHGFH